MRLTRALLACGIAGPVLFSTVVLIEGATRPGYSAWRNAASQLALGDQGWMQTVNFFVGGLLFAGFAIGLWRTLRSGPASTWAPRLIAGMGVCFVLAGIFPINPGLGYPPGVAPSYSLHGAIHFVAATLLVVQLCALCFVLARRFAADAGWTGWAPWSRAIGVIVPVFYVATVVVTSIDPGGMGVAAWNGVLQRIALFSGFGLLSLVAWQVSARELVGPGLADPDDSVHEGGS